jgi:membrane associated rhomboid family serine protease
MESSLTFTIIIFCIIIHVAAFIGISLFDISSETILENLAFSWKNFLSKPYTLLTSIFLHLDIEHLLSNLLVFLFFGTALEREIGKLRMLTIFLLGGIAGNIISALFYGYNSYFLGASGAIFAIIGAGMLITPLDISFYPYMFPIPLGVLGILYAIYNVLGFLYGAENISYIGHFAGMLIGCTYGLKYTGIKKGILIIIIMGMILLLPLIFIFV